MIGDARREGVEQRGELSQLVRDLAEELRISDKKNRRAGLLCASIYARTAALSSFGDKAALLGGCADVFGGGAGM
eukprot:1072821-Rhodomonas_salina.1